MNRYLFLTMVFALFCALKAQDTTGNSPIPAQACSPEIRIVHKGQSQTVCLNEFTPGADSCADVDINLEKIAGISFRFHCDSDHKWSYSGVESKNETSRLKNINLDLTSDHNQNLEKASITLGSGDTQKVDLHINQRRDIPVKRDTVRPFEYSVNWTAFRCVKKPGTEQVETFIAYSYPPGYGDRGAKINCAERQMFHHRSSVVMPTSGSVRNRGALINIYHILHPPKLEYGEDFEGRKFRYGENARTKRRKKKKKKKGWLQIKPLK
ncbi:MAG: hypothetical protein ACLFQB_05210 [Chitinispirillaceae bacterium]